MNYSREDAKRTAREQIPDFLLKAKKKGYVCPKCGNGTGNTGDGIVLDKKDGKHYKCFKCGIYADIFELYGLYYGLSDNAEVFRQVYEYYGIEVENKQGRANESYQKHTLNPTDIDILNKPLINYTAFFQQAMEANDFLYLQGRGISKATQRKFTIGYVPAWVHPKALKAPATPRCIIPTSEHSYLARDTRKTIPEQQQRYKKSKVGRIEIFNIKEMSSSNVVFITEGEIDAISIYEVSDGIATAIAIGSTAYHNIFMDRLKQNYNGQVFVLMLDNDESDPEQPDKIPAGQNETQKLKRELSYLNIPVLVAEYEYKDPNEYLMKDRDGMKNTILSLQVKAEHIWTGNKYNAAELLNYFRTIEKQPSRFEVKTGFEKLDNNLSGGLHEGLIIIGAVSGLGKTTLLLQLADQIASTGMDVIFFSLEMSKFELIAKSISRHTYKLVRDKKAVNGHYLAKDTMQVLDSRKYKYYSPEERKVITDAIENYETSAIHLYIYEGRYREKRMTVQHVRDIVKDHVHKISRKPVVIIDYLQMLALTDSNFTDKQNTDMAVFELKEISRDYSIPVIAISSFNRENYLEPVSMSSFKESGAVEYSSDILFGLQYAGMDYQDEEKESDRKRRIRELRKRAEIKKSNKEPVEIDLKCLKNRNGHIFTITFNAIMTFNYLEEVDLSGTILENIESMYGNTFNHFKNKIPVK